MKQPLTALPAKTPGPASSKPDAAAAAAAAVKPAAPPRRRRTLDESTVVSVGAVSLPVYRLGDGRWCVAYPGGPDGTRVRLTRVRREDAIRAAEALCISIAHGNAAAGALAPAVRVQAAAALALLEPRGLTLEGTVREALAALDAVGGRVSLLEMARDYAKRHPAGNSRATAAQVHAEFLREKGENELSAKHEGALRCDLATFAAAFPDRPMADIDREAISAWLRTRPVGWRRRLNLRNTVVSLFRFAAGRKHLPQDQPTEAERVPRPPRPRLATLPAIFTPAQIRLLLGHVSPAWLPALALAAFAGLRRAECARLVWERHILWEERVIHIDATVAKHTTRRRGDVRFVEMRPNLLAWLAPWRTARGPIHPRVRWEEETGRLRRHLEGGRWPNNALRRSWISYRDAESGGNLVEVSGEAGNSPPTARKHYLNPRLRRQAAEYFDIFPDGAGGVAPPANVVRMDGAMG